MRKFFAICVAWSARLDFLPFLNPSKRGVAPQLSEGENRPSRQLLYANICLWMLKSLSKFMSVALGEIGHVHCFIIYLFLFFYYLGIVFTNIFICVIALSWDSPLQWQVLRTLFIRKDWFIYDGSTIDSKWVFKSTRIAL